MSVFGSTVSTGGATATKVWWLSASWPSAPATMARSDSGSLMALSHNSPSRIAAGTSAMRIHPASPRLAEGTFRASGMTPVTVGSSSCLTGPSLGIVCPRGAKRRAIENDVDSPEYGMSPLASASARRSVRLAGLTMLSSDGLTADCPMNPSYASHKSRESRWLRLVSFRCGPCSTRERRGRDQRAPRRRSALRWYAQPARGTPRNDRATRSPSRLRSSLWC